MDLHFGYQIETVEITRKEAAALPSWTHVLVYNPFVNTFDIYTLHPNCAIIHPPNKLYDKFFYYAIKAVPTATPAVTETVTPQDE